MKSQIGIRFWSHNRDKARRSATARVQAGRQAHYPGDRRTYTRKICYLLSAICYFI
jgi:hypothetical protein